MPKISSADHINAAFEDIGEALNNPKLREGFLNGNKENIIINELVDMFDKQRLNGANKEKDLIGENSHKNKSHNRAHSSKGESNLSPSYKR